MAFWAQFCVRWNTFLDLWERELLELLDGDGSNGWTGVLARIGTAHGKPCFVLTWLDKPEEALRCNCRQQGRQTVAGDSDHVRGKCDLNRRIVALGVDEPEPGQGEYFAAKLDHKGGRLRALLGQVPIFRDLNGGGCWHDLKHSPSDEIAPSEFGFAAERDTGGNPRPGNASCIGLPELWPKRDGLIPWPTAGPRTLQWIPGAPKRRW